MTSLRERVRSTPGGRLAWRIGATLVGVALIVGGIVLLPLPGPGWLIIFAGLGILATEYEWAARLLRFARGKVSAWTRLGRHAIAPGAGADRAGRPAGLAALVAAAWWYYTR